MEESSSGLRGVHDPEKPNQAGWGGKFIHQDATTNHWFDDPERAKAVYRSRTDVHADFANRTDWTLPSK